MKYTRLATTPSHHPCTPCVHSKRPRVCRQNARMCFNMCAWCWYTRGRCGRTHTTHHTAPQDTTQHDTPQHNMTHHTAPQQKQQKHLPTTRYPQHTTQHTTRNTQQHTQTHTQPSSHPTAGPMDSPAVQRQTGWCHEGQKEEPVQRRNDGTWDTRENPLNQIVRKPTKWTQVQEIVSTLEVVTVAKALPDGSQWHQKWVPKATARPERDSPRPKLSVGPGCLRVGPRLSHSSPVLFRSGQVVVLCGGTAQDWIGTGTGLPSTKTVCWCWVVPLLSRVGPVPFWWWLGCCFWSDHGSTSRGTTDRLVAQHAAFFFILRRQRQACQRRRNDRNRWIMHCRVGRPTLWTGAACFAERRGQKKKSSWRGIGGFGERRDRCISFVLWRTIHGL